MGFKPFPIGVDNFKEMIQEGYYYVDKTLLIKELLKIGKLTEEEKEPFLQYVMLREQMQIIWMHCVFYQLVWRKVIEKK